MSESKSKSKSKSKNDNPIDRTVLTNTPIVNSRISTRKPISRFTTLVDHIPSKELCPNDDFIQSAELSLNFVLRTHIKAIALARGLEEAGVLGIAVLMYPDGSGSFVFQSTGKNTLITIESWMFIQQSLFCDEIMNLRYKPDKVAHPEGYRAFENHPESEVRHAGILETRFNFTPALGVYADTEILDRIKLFKENIKWYGSKQERIEAIREARKIRDQDVNDAIDDEVNVINRNDRSSNVTKH